MNDFQKLLASYKTIAIDAVCFIYYFEAHEQYGPLAKQIFSALSYGKLKATTSVLTISELLAFEKLQNDSLLYEKTKIKLRTTPRLDIIPIDETIAELAAILKTKYTIALPDGLHIASAIVTKQDAFITNDKKLKKITEIPILVLNDFIK